MPGLWTSRLDDDFQKRSQNAILHIGRYAITSTTPRQVNSLVNSLSDGWSRKGQNQSASVSDLSVVSREILDYAEEIGRGAVPPNGTHLIGWLIDAVAARDCVQCHEHQIEIGI